VFGIRVAGFLIVLSMAVSMPRALHGMEANAVLAVPAPQDQNQNQKPPSNHPPVSPKPRPTQPAVSPTRDQGKWLNQHKNLPADQQEKALENDPGFKKLSPPRQAQLRAQLRKFNSLPHDQQEQMLKRMQFMGSLPEEQRNNVRQAHQQFQQLPNDRKQVVKQALRNLRQLPRDKRQQELQSEKFRSSFSDQEQQILRQLAEINPPQPKQEHPAPSQ